MKRLVSHILTATDKFDRSKNGFLFPHISKHLNICTLTPFNVVPRVTRQTVSHSNANKVQRFIIKFSMLCLSMVAYTYFCVPLASFDRQINFTYGDNDRDGKQQEEEQQLNISTTTSVWWRLKRIDTFLGYDDKWRSGWGADSRSIINDPRNKTVLNWWICFSNLILEIYMFFSLSLFLTLFFYLLYSLLSH